MSKGRESKLKDFYVVRLTSPTSMPPMLQMLTIDLQCVNKPLQQEIIPNLLTQVYPNTYNHSK